MLLRITGLLVFCCSGFTSGQHWDVRLQAQQGNVPQQFGAAITPPTTTPTTAVPTTTQSTLPPIPEHVPPLKKNHIYCEVNHFGDSSGDMLECGHLDTKRFDEGELAFEGWNTITCLIAAPPGTGYRNPAGPYRPGEYGIVYGMFFNSKNELIETLDDNFNYERVRFDLWERHSDGSITDKSMKYNLYRFPGDVDWSGRKDYQISSPPRYEMPGPPLTDGNYILVPFDWECMKDLAKMFYKAPIVTTRYGRLGAMHDGKKGWLSVREAEHIWIGWLKYIDHTNMG